MITLSPAQVKKLHTKQLAATGGADGIRDETMLESAVAAPFQTFGGVALYPVTEKIVRIAYSLVCNHPFVDGNKRIGTYVLLILLGLNGIDVDFTDDDIVHIGLSLAAGKMSYKQLLYFVEEHITHGNL